MTLKDFASMLRPLATKIANVVGRGVIKRVDDAKKVQELQVSLLDGEVREEIERFQQYGMTSVPEADAEAVVVFIGGRRDQGYVVGVEDRRYRPTGLAEGEVCVYSKHGQTITLKTNGDVEIAPKAGSLVTLAGATNPIAKGDSLNTAIANLGTAIAGALTTMGAAAGVPMPGALAATAGTTITAAVTAFNAAATAALSTKVKLS